MPEASKESQALWQKVRRGDTYKKAMTYFERMMPLRKLQQADPDIVKGEVTALEGRANREGMTAGQIEDLAAAYLKADPSERKRLRQGGEKFTQEDRF